MELVYMQEMQFLFLLDCKCLDRKVSISDDNSSILSSCSEPAMGAVLNLQVVDIHTRRISECSFSTSQVKKKRQWMFDEFSEI